MKDFNSRRNRILISLLLALPSYPLLHLIRNLPFSRITSYAFVEYSLMAFVAFFVIFEFQNLSSRRISRHLSWHQFGKRLAFELLVSLVVTTIVVTAAYSALYILVWKMGIFIPSIILYVTIVFFISICFMVIVNAAPVISQWKTSIVKAEQMEKQSVNARLEALRNQLSPHFFFNNLSILNGLIDEDSAQAKKFTDKLSEVFRYILRHRDDQLVPLSEELGFIKDYQFLLETRFPEKVKIDLKTTNAGQFLIPPVTLQQLVENAVKHNETSKEKPLCISIEIGEQSLIVRNKLNQKKSLIESTGVGLSGIKERFSLITDRPVEIRNDNEMFSVELPLIAK